MAKTMRPAVIPRAIMKAFNVVGSLYQGVKEPQSWLHSSARYMRVAPAMKAPIDEVEGISVYRFRVFDSWYRHDGVLVLARIESF